MKKRNLKERLARLGAPTSRDRADETCDETCDETSDETSEETPVGSDDTAAPGAGEQAAPGTQSDIAPVKDVASAKERLRRLLAAKGRGLEFAEAVKRLDAPPRPAPRRAERLDLDAVVDGDWRETAHGHVFVVEHLHPLDEGHAGVSLGDLLDCGTAGLAGLESRCPADFDFSRAVFLDTETTGLAGGTGTLPFLVGVGRFTAAGYLLRQLFIDSPAAERGQLDLLAEWLDDCSGLVTYNGRAFDWPLLRTRYLLNGLRPSFIERTPDHVDLLAWARRLWRHRLPSCSLAEVERGVLAVERHGDIPGAEIPALYFAYLRGAPVTERLGRIFYHNEQDICSLPVLAARALRLAAEPLQHYQCPTELFGLGLLDYYTDVRSELWEAALAEGLEDELRRRACWELSLHYKRAADFERARPLWAELRRGPYDARPYEEEAKFLEHRVGRYAEAAELVEEALGRARRVLTDPVRRERDLARLEHRRERLRRRLAGRDVTPPQEEEP